MIFILIAILFNAYIGIIFKHFGKARVNSQVAIVVNYWICVGTGFFVSQSNPVTLQNLQSPWFSWSVLIGLLLITIFNVMSLSSIRIGVTLTQAANKMSLAIPVLFSLYLYQEQLNMFKALGICCALVGVYLVTYQEQKDKGAKKDWWLLPALFLGSGAIDTITKYVEINYIKSNLLLNQYLIFCFGAAAIIGSIYLVYQITNNKLRINKRSILAGIILGIPNYFSIYFLIKALQYKDLTSSAIIPINNIGILIVVTLYGFLIFKERLGLKNKIGLGLALASIILLLSAG